jgi:hypothetical protein
LSYQILLRVEFKKVPRVELDPPQWKLGMKNQETPTVEIRDEKSRDPHSGN